MDTLKYHSSGLSTLNTLRREYKHSCNAMTAINKGMVSGFNKGAYLNQCKQDKKALKDHADLLRAQFNRGKL